METGLTGWWKRWGWMMLLGTLLEAPACDGTLNDDTLSMEGSLQIAPSDGSGVLAVEASGLDGAALRARLAKEQVTPEMSDWRAWESVTFDRIVVVLPGAADGGDLIDSIALYQTRPTEPDVKIASVSQIPRGAATVALDVEGVDLTQAILDEGSRVRVEAHGPGATAARRLAVDATLRVDWPDDASCRPSNHF